MWQLKDQCHLACGGCRWELPGSRRAPSPRTVPGDPLTGPVCTGPSGFPSPTQGYSRPRGPCGRATKPWSIFSACGCRGELGMVDMHRSGLSMLYASGDAPTLPWQSSNPSLYCHLVAQPNCQTQDRASKQLSTSLRRQLSASLSPPAILRPRLGGSGLRPRSPTAAPQVINDQALQSTRDSALRLLAGAALPVKISQNKDHRYPILLVDSAAFNISTTESTTGRTNITYPNLSYTRKYIKPFRRRTAPSRPE